MILRFIILFSFGIILIIIFISTIITEQYGIFVVIQAAVVVVLIEVQVSISF